MSQLRFYVDAWKHSADAISDLNISSADWERDTDLPGWRVRDILAHLVHLENVLLNGEVIDRSEGDAPVPADYTNAGVAALRDTDVTTLRKDFATLISGRAEELQVLPEEGSTKPPRTPANAPWDTDTLLRNRAFDMWMHEQDIRRAVNQPGNMDSPGAHLTSTVTAMAMPFVVGKKAKAPIGTIVRFIVTGPVHVDVTVQVGEDGRAKSVPETQNDADATLTMDTETFILLGGGRKDVSEVNASIDGNQELGNRVLSSMTITF